MKIKDNNKKKNYNLQLRIITIHNQTKSKSIANK